MTLLPILLSLASVSWGYTPIAVSTDPKTTNDNFMEISMELQKLNCIDGCEMRQNVKVSSALHVTGDLQVDGNVSFSGSLDIDINFSSATVSWTNATAAIDVCVASATLTSTSGKVWVEFSGTAEYAAAASVDHRWGFLVNDSGTTSRPTGQSVSTGIGRCQTSTDTQTNPRCNLSAKFLYISGTSEITYCFAPYSSNAGGDSAGSVINSFYVFEAR